MEEVLLIQGFPAGTCQQKGMARKSQALALAGVKGPRKPFDPKGRAFRFGSPVKGSHRLSGSLAALPGSVATLGDGKSRLLPAAHLLLRVSAPIRAWRKIQLDCPA